jgi:hypothetical protein
MGDRWLTLVLLKMERTQEVGDLSTLLGGKVTVVRISSFGVRCVLG